MLWIETGGIARNEYLACLFIKQGDNDRFGELKQSFMNDGLKGESTYPNSIEDACILLKGYKRVGAGLRGNNTRAGEESSLAFAEVGERQTRTVS